MDNPAPVTLDETPAPSRFSSFITAFERARLPVLVAALVLTFVGSLLLSLSLSQSKQQQQVNAYEGNWYNPAWQYRKKITISHARVTGDQANFPVLLSFTDAQLASAARPDGFDIVVTAGDGSTKLPLEREKYIASTGQYVGWVKVASLSASTDTNLFVYYGNAASCDQTSRTCDATSDATKVWTNNFKAVYHLKENPSVVNCPTNKEVCDSVATSNADNSGGLTASSQVDGQIDGSLLFNGSTNYLSAPSTANLQNATNMTYQAWVYWKGSSNSYSYLFEKGANNSQDSYALAVENSTSRLQFGFNTSSGKTRLLAEPSGTLAQNQWVLVTVVYDDTDNVLRFYKNGVQTGTVSTTDALHKRYSSPLVIGRQNNNTSTRYPWNGMLDEIRVAGVARSAAWIATEYANQSSPGTFYTIGLPESYTTSTPTGTPIPTIAPSITPEVSPTQNASPSASPPAGGSPTPSVVGTTPVGINGQLSVCGNYICNQFGKPIQLRGMSTHGLQWYGWGKCVTPASIDALANDWKADILRISLYVQEGGYETNPTAFKNQVDQTIDQAVSQGIYTLIDWHMLEPGDPNYNLTRAKEYFTYIAEKHGSKPNMIYEIANEPSGVSWAQIKSYADQIIPVIRAYDPDAIILVGTRGWSSLGVSEGGNAQEVVSNPVIAPNIMYTFHFYAASHKTEYLSELAWAADRLPIFVTEWGTQAYTGDGSNNFVSAQSYLDLMAAKKISWTSWNYSDDFRSGAVFKTGTCPNGPFTGITQLKPAGVWVRDHIISPADNFPTY